MKRRQWEPFAFASPSLGLIALVIVFPLGYSFFLSLQNAARDWIQLGATKTGVVYRLKGNPPHAHE